MPDDERDQIPPALARAVELLREEEVVSPAWRAAVLGAVEQGSGSRDADLRPRRFVALRTAIAAGIVCAAAGSAATLAVLRRPGTIETVATAPHNAAQASTLLPVHFSVVAPSAASVSIVGDFNHWSPTALPMKRSADGRTWEIDVRLPEGRYNYAYMVDGQIARDPSAPQTGGDDFGMPNSVLMVRGT
ncbi:MAG TPA: isoamylase early set domain-containing protein [Gemmatimonadaceae bacterium]|nr:isoamylase early set domain-containing protein [Gemmatimonadaceae bacterium]